MSNLFITNTLTRKKEPFQPLHPPYIGMYVCGPTVYGDAHLGHARPAITFDLVYRYLLHLGYKVRYVRNITDVGHLENDADEGEDKIAKQAKLQHKEPMEVAQHYTNNYHSDMQRLNVKNPNIEPHASGHITEQIRMIEKILENDMAYIVNGSVYFDVMKYNSQKPYGILSGRTPDEQMAGERELDAQEEKKNKVDFALWKKAMPEHIMRWTSPWGEGFPGWHIECSAMSTKYLGETFDIHGGGMDLLFPHHECEIAQSQGSNGKTPVKYWLHNNMITINGQKMGKSLGNFITLHQLFSGNHPLLEQPYSPMTIRFYILQSHYRSTLDFSNEALRGAEKAFKKIINGLMVLKSLVYIEDTDKSASPALNDEIIKACVQCKEGLNDDFNSAVTIAALFQLLKYINSFKAGILDIQALSLETFSKMKETYSVYVEDILGLKEDDMLNTPEMKHGLINVILKLYEQAKTNKDYSTVDKIRSELKQKGIVIKDTKNGFEWAYDE